MNDEAVSPPHTITLLIERANAGDATKARMLLSLALK
jgi:hypothetical protein